ncbi:hypothetical protein PoB_002977100 [Plakobranchus ocellatus]|uniref:Uncharacterized protein n=1 Tax=Plakobranchus ocellatus TaxID=259542 RepID=A0AAV3ZWC7_9GAST|nr:hypothetical protein PoB_002977100 [Plakobranchus ocellatus]
MTTDDHRKNSASHSCYGQLDFSQQKQLNVKGPMECTKWRSRSLSELPGHLRVPVLRRKDTERTQARLEAGVAGLAELRQLREQQTVRVEQTVAASLRHKYRPSSGHKKSAKYSENVSKFDATAAADDEKDEQVESQVIDQTQNSALSLCSIREETTIAGRDTTNIRSMKGGSLCLKVSNQLSCSAGDYYKSFKGKDIICRQNSRRYSEDISISRQKTESLRQLAEGTSLIYYQSKNLIDDAKDSRVCEESSSPRPEDGIDMGQSMKLSQPQHGRQKRSASVDIPAITRPTKYMSWDNLLTLVGLQNQSNETKEVQCDNMPACPKTIQSSNESRLSETSLKSETSSSSLERGVVHVKTGRSHSLCCDRHFPKFSQASDFSNTTKHKKDLEKTNGVDGNRTDNVQNNRDENAFINTKPVSSHIDMDNKNAIIRRASIQCETVLTGVTARSRKICNPLHEIDVFSLRSPGPLHAVTLQYNGIPLNALPEEVESSNGMLKSARGRSASLCTYDSNYFSAADPNNNKNEISEEEHRPSKIQLSKTKLNKATKQSTRRSLQSISENDNNRTPSPHSRKMNHGKCKLHEHSETNSSTLTGKEISELNTKDDHLIITSEIENYEDNSYTVDNVSKLSGVKNSYVNQIDYEKAEIPSRISPVEFLPVSENLSSGAFTLNPPAGQHYNFSSTSSNIPTLICETPPCPIPEQSRLPCPAPSISTPKVIIPDYQLSPISPQNQPYDLPDVSLILSDDGYSTCDSVGAQSRLSIGPAYSSTSSSDWSSLSSGSVSNVSLASAFCSSSAISAHRRTPVSRPPRFSHPPNSSRIASTLRPKSCSAERADVWPLLSTLTHVPEGSSSDISSSMSLCPLKTDESKNSEKDSDALNNNLSSSQPNKGFASQNLPSPDFDSVFSDDISYPTGASPHLNDQFWSVTAPSQNISAKSSTPMTSLQPTGDSLNTGCEGKVQEQNSPTVHGSNYVMLEEGAVIHLDGSEDSHSNCRGSREPASTQIQRTVGRGTRTMTPNLGVKQTAV